MDHDEDSRRDSIEILRGYRLLPITPFRQKRDRKEEEAEGETGGERNRIGTALERYSNHEEIQTRDERTKRDTLDAVICDKSEWRELGVVSRRSPDIYVSDARFHRRRAARKLHTEASLRQRSRNFPSVLSDDSRRLSERQFSPMAS